MAPDTYRTAHRWGLSERSGPCCNSPGGGGACPCSSGGHPRGPASGTSRAGSPGILPLRRLHLGLHVLTLHPLDAVSACLVPQPPGAPWLGRASSPFASSARAELPAPHTAWVRPPWPHGFLANPSRAQPLPPPHRLGALRPSWPGGFLAVPLGPSRCRCTRDAACPPWDSAGGFPWPSAAVADTSSRPSCVGCGEPTDWGAVLAPWAGPLAPAALAPSGRGLAGSHHHIVCDRVHSIHVPQCE